MVDRANCKACCKHPAKRYSVFCKGCCKAFDELWHPADSFARAAYVHGALTFLNDRERLGESVAIVKAERYLRLAEQGLESLFQ